MPVHNSYIFTTASGEEFHSSGLTYPERLLVSDLDLDLETKVVSYDSISGGEEVGDRREDVSTIEVSYLLNDPAGLQSEVNNFYRVLTTCVKITQLGPTGAESYTEGKDDKYFLEVTPKNVKLKTKEGAKGKFTEISCKFNVRSSLWKVERTSKVHNVYARSQYRFNLSLNGVSKAYPIFNFSFSPRNALTYLTITNEKTGDRFSIKGRILDGSNYHIDTILKVDCLNGEILLEESKINDLLAVGTSFISAEAGNNSIIIVCSTASTMWFTYQEGFAVV